MQNFNLSVFLVWAIEIVVVSIAHDVDDVDMLIGVESLDVGSDVRGMLRPIVAVRTLETR